MMIDVARYWLALLVVVAIPPVPVIWIVAHRFVDRWRRLGPRITYAALITGWLAVAATMYSFRGPLLSDDLGRRGWLMVAAALSYGTSVFIEVFCWRQISFRILVGVPEFTPIPETGRLMKDGIYARLRHPRYLSLTLGVLGVTLFANYLGAYIVFLAFVIGIYIVTVFEERELVDRFGDAYRIYRSRVPRLIPRLRPRTFGHEGGEATADPGPGRRS